MFMWSQLLKNYDLAAQFIKLQNGMVLMLNSKGGMCYNVKFQKCASLFFFLIAQFFPLSIYSSLYVTFSLTV